MPAIAALKRLVSYYQSQQFADDLARQIVQDPQRAKVYRQHIIDLLNASENNDPAIMSEVTSQEQERFVNADMPIADLIFQARLYTLRWTIRQKPMV